MCETPEDPERQSSFVARNLRIIRTLLSSTTLRDALKRASEKDATTRKVHWQRKKHMLDTKTHRVDSRIVSFSQPHIRPIVRGKAGARVGIRYAKLLSVAIERRGMPLSSTPPEN
ncbi:hypothetical protein MASR2M79_10750 [Aminivibrio sp.]